DTYYENGPFPTCFGWYVQQRLPHAVHAATAAAVLAVELGVALGAFLPRRARIYTFGMTALLQVGILLTANYGFLNYFVLLLGVLLLDDRFFARFGLPTPPSGTMAP